MAQSAAHGQFAYSSAETPNLPHYAPQQLHHLHQQDSKRGYSLDDSHTEPAPLLDLEQEISMRAPIHHYRKDSFANSSGVLSPVDPSPWDSNSQYHAALPVDQRSQTAGFVAHYHHDAENAFPPHQTLSHAPAYPPQPLPPQHGSWPPMASAPAHATPASAFEPPHSQPVEGAPFMQRHGSAHAAYGQPPSQASSVFAAQPQPDASFIASRPQADANFNAAPQVHTPMSPHSHQDWMAIAAQEMESRPMLKRMRPNSPPRTMVDFQRRDGIRKKNGRIDIPQERNIHTIDDLIEKTTDDNLLKELKQQKRLLRNREAAYVDDCLVLMPIPH